MSQKKVHGKDYPGSNCSLTVSRQWFSSQSCLQLRSQGDLSMAKHFSYIFIMTGQGIARWLVRKQTTCLLSDSS